MRKKILVDIYLAFNLGDDMFLDYLVKQFPQVDWIPFYPGHSYDDFFSKYPNVNRFPYSWFDKVMARFGKNKLTNYYQMSKDYDGLLFLGGGIFREESYWEEVYHYRSSIVAAFKSKKKPVWFMGSNFGPYKSDKFLNSHKKLFAEVDSIGFRDLKSYALFKNIPSVFYAPDLLWGYPLTKHKKQEKLLGISVIAPKHKQGFEHTEAAYIASHQEVIHKYKNQGYAIKLFAFCEVEGDRKIAQKIKAEDSSIEIIDYNGDIELFMEEWARCSHIVAARFHAVIMAMKLDQQLIPVVYSIKTINLLEDLDIKPPYISLNDIENLAEKDFLNVNQEKVYTLAKDSLKHLKIKL